MDNYFLSLATIYVLLFYMHRDIITNVIDNLIWAYSLTINRFILCSDTKEIIDCFSLTKRYNCKSKHIMLHRVRQGSSRDFISLNYYNCKFKSLVYTALLEARIDMAISVIAKIIINLISMIKLYNASTDKIKARRALNYMGCTPSIRIIYAQDIKQHKLIKNRGAMRQRERRNQEWRDWPEASRRERRGGWPDGRWWGEPGRRYKRKALEGSRAHSGERFQTCKRFRI